MGIIPYNTVCRAKKPEKKKKKKLSKEHPDLVFVKSWVTLDRSEQTHQKTSKNTWVMAYVYDRQQPVMKRWLKKNGASLHM